MQFFRQYLASSLAGLKSDYTEKHVKSRSKHNTRCKRGDKGMIEQY